MATNKIALRGAREHNLQNIDLDIPRDQLVVITGLSGSGKSTLAFDTIYAEGQRRYVESLSAYARQFLDRMSKPDLDSIEGLSPAISIEQRSASRNPRSTVGTVTEIYDYLRLLFARVGRPTCPKCGRAIASQTVQQMVDQVLAMAPGTKLSVLAPIVRDRKGEYRKELDSLRRDGFVRVRIDGEARDLADEIVLDRKRKHDIDLFVDRLVVKEGMESRLADSLELALKLGGGLVRLLVKDGEETLLSSALACVECGFSFPEIEPRFFSFNSPHGSCPKCMGLGAISYFDPDLIVPDPSLSLTDGAVAPWHSKTANFYRISLEAVAKHYGFGANVPWGELDERAREVVLQGSGKEIITFTFRSDRMTHTNRRAFEGVIPNLDRRYKETQSEAMREEMERYMSQRACPDCGGARLRPEALAVRVQGRSIVEVTGDTIKESLRFFRDLKLSEREEAIARLILREIRSRLTFLMDVGLDYISLDRGASTLSGGESQRIRLATQIGSSLVGVLYILDEPSIGLHQRDNERLLNTLCRLRDLGNTVLVVEHDEDTIRRADHVIDMGPGAGNEGGRVVVAGTPEEVEACEGSVTGQFLSGAREIPVPEARRRGNGKWLEVHGATLNNLKDLSVSLPLGLFVCVTGVSGSGKSSLVVDSLLPELKHRLMGARRRAGPGVEVRGLEHLDKVVDIDQSAIGRTPRSNPATYTGLMTPLRELFAMLPEAKARGYKAGRFSFNVKGGRCEACQGAGVVRIEMHFLPDVFVQCSVCQGRRYDRETLEVRYKGLTISEALGLTVDRALEVFSAVPPMKNKLKILAEVGLGYITLGQPATTLSGGEAQRIKLAKELSRRSTGRTMYILDEPTTGLHFADVEKLLQVLSRLVDSGNTVIVIEHNLDVVKSADFVVDLGPEGGDEGGEVVVAGTPEEVAVDGGSYTGHFLARILGLDRHRARGSRALLIQSG